MEDKEDPTYTLSVFLKKRMKQMEQKDKMESTN